MSDQFILTDFDEATKRRMAEMQSFPHRIYAGIARGLDKAAEHCVGHLRENRLSGKGPYPVEDHRLGVVSHNLSNSVTRTNARVEGESVSLTIGDKMPYAKIHEFGGVIKRTVKPGKVRLRTDKRGELIRGRTGGAVFARNSHKLARTVSYDGGGQYEIHMPARHTFGHGIADEAQVFKDQVALGIRDEWKRGGAA